MGRSKLTEKQTENIDPETAQAEAPAVVYLAIVGISKGDVRIEPGEVVPPEIIAGAPWLIENNHVRPRKGTSNG
jgi:hypothetical protein